MTGITVTAMAQRYTPFGFSAVSKHYVFAVTLGFDMLCGNTMTRCAIARYNFDVVFVMASKTVVMGHLKHLLY
ncbi:MAG: hypothetical protein QNJ97_03695 [Myxococcota bacterium]|nr:hypothetical protein [Myxococcota bacterium]